MSVNYHSHKCRCGRKFPCKGVKYTSGTEALMFPCPHLLCSFCSKKEMEDWAKWLKTNPETRQYSGLDID